jgi:hypothetical protein
MFPKALSFLRPAQSPETLPAPIPPANSSLPECDCLFLFMFLQTAEQVLRGKINKNDFFYCDYEALKVFQKYRCHPV